MRYDISDIEVTSPTGAPTDLEVDLVPMGGADHVELRIGDEDQPLTETRQTYRIAYTLDGAMRSSSASASRSRAAPVARTCAGPPSLPA